MTNPLLSRKARPSRTAKAGQVFVTSMAVVAVTLHGDRDRNGGETVRMMTTFPGLMTTTVKVGRVGTAVADDIVTSVVLVLLLSHLGPTGKERGSLLVMAIDPI